MCFFEDDNRYSNNRLNPYQEETIRQNFQDAKDYLAAAEFFYDPDRSDGVQSKEAKQFIEDAEKVVASISKLLKETAPECGWKNYIFNPGIDLCKLEEFSEQIKVAKNHLSEGLNVYEKKCDENLKNVRGQRKERCEQYEKVDSFFTRGKQSYESYFDSEDEQNLINAGNYYKLALLVLKEIAKYEIIKYDGRLQNQMQIINNKLESVQKTMDAHDENQRMMKSQIKNK